MPTYLISWHFFNLYRILFQNYSIPLLFITCSKYAHIPLIKESFITIQNIYKRSFIDYIKDNLIPSTTIPIPIIARISPINFPTTEIKLAPTFLTIRSLNKKEK